MGRWASRCRPLCLVGLAAIFPSGRAFADFKVGHIYTTKTAYECGTVPERIYEFDPVSKTWTLFAELPGCWISGLAFAPDGSHLRVGSYGGSLVLELDGNGFWSVALSSADGISAPLGFNCIAYDAKGDFYVLSLGNSYTIKRFPGGSPPGVVIANNAMGINGAGPIAVAPDGTVYHNPAGYGPNQSPAAILRYPPGGGANFFDLVLTGDVGSLVVDSAGNLYVSTHKGLFRYRDADPTKKELVTSLFFDPQRAITLSPGETHLYGNSGLNVVDLVTGSVTSNPSLPPQPLNGGWGWGLAVCAPKPGCSADLDGDGIVCQSDLGILLSAYGTCVGQPGYSPKAAALGGDSCVGQEDLGVLLAQYGSCGGPCP